MLLTNSLLVNDVFTQHKIINAFQKIGNSTFDIPFGGIKNMYLLNYNGNCTITLPLLDDINAGLIIYFRKIAGVGFTISFTAGGGCRIYDINQFGTTYVSSLNNLTNTNFSVIYYGGGFWYFLTRL